MKNPVAYRNVLRTLALSFLCATFLLSSCGGGGGGAGAPHFDISVTFNVSQLHPNVPVDVLNRPRNGPISTIGVDPGNENNVLVASESGGLFRSFDGALTWRHEDTLPSNSTLGIAYLRGGSIIVTAAAGFEASGGGVWIQGPPWSGWTNLARVYSLFPAPGPQCSATPGAYDIAVAPDTAQIYIGTDCGVAIGSPDAGTWRHVEIPGASMFSSITALGGGHLIIGGPGGVWYSRDDGTRWHRETTGIDHISYIHGLSRDPRSGDRAYAINDAKQLYETTNGGLSWSQITVDPGANNCGGIAFAKAVQQQAQVKLYFGDRCNTRVTSFDATTEPTRETPVWSRLTLRQNDHDVRDLAFHPRQPARIYLMSSDGGLESTTDGTNFDWITRPWLGLDANQVTEVTGQYNGTGSFPDLYFATWHDGVFAVGQSRSSGLCTEGWGFGMLRRVPSVTGVKISAGCMGQNLITDSLFENSTQWPASAQHFSTPVILSQGTYVQSIDHGMQYTTDTGATWRQIAVIPEAQHDRPKPAGPASDPTLIQALQTGTQNDQQVVGLVRVSGFSSGGTGSIRYARMDEFGTIGVFPTQISYEVYGVDPNDATHIIAADGSGNSVKVSTDGGDNWHEIPGLTDLVSHHGEYLMGLSAGDRTATLVSSISFCPDNSSRVLIGTRQGGAYFSSDGGWTWRPVTGSDGIVNTTSFFWLDGCGSVWASTYGRGIWRIDMTLTSALNWNELLCKPCPFDKFNRDLLLDEHPDPKSIQALIVMDGQITAINQSGGTTLVSVSQGSVLLTYGDLPNLKVDFEKDTDLPDPLLSKQGVIQGMLFQNQKMSLITDSSQLELYSKEPGKMGPGMAETLASKKPSIDVISETNAFGAPTVMSGEPLIIRVGNMESVQQQELTLQIDGQDVAKVDTSQKVFEYVDKLTQWPMGYHVVALVANGPKGSQTVWVTDFLVPHDDDEPLSKNQ